MPSPLLCTFAATYAIASAAEVCLVKWLNYRADVWLVVFTALVLNQAWLFVLPSWWRTRVRRREEKRLAAARAAATVILVDAYVARVVPITPPPSPGLEARKRRRLVAIYVALGVVTFGVTLLRNLALNHMPGSVFGVLISMSVVFNLALSITVLRERFNRWHVAAGACCLAAAVAVGLPRLLERGGGRGANYAVGVPAALGAAMCVALMSVLTDRLSRSVAVGDKALRIAEQTITSSFIASLLLVPVLFGTGEWRLWAPELSSAWRAAPAVLMTAAIAMPATKAAVRTAKYETVGRGGSYFFEFVQSAAAILASVANVVLFGEAWTWTYVGALVLLAAGFALFMVARRRQAQAAVAAAKPQDTKVVIAARRSSSVSVSSDAERVGGQVEGRAPMWWQSRSARGSTATGRSAMFDNVAPDEHDAALEEVEAGAAAFGVRRNNGAPPRFIASRPPVVHLYKASPSLAMEAAAVGARCDVASALPPHMRNASAATSARAVGSWDQTGGRGGSGDTPVMTLRSAAAPATPAMPQATHDTAAASPSATPLPLPGTPARMEFEPTCADLREKVLGFVDVPLEAVASGSGGGAGGGDGQATRVVGNDAPGVREAAGLPASGTAAMNDSPDDHGWRIHAADPP